jgi:subtilisin family serine protease
MNHHSGLKAILIAAMTAVASFAMAGTPKSQDLLVKYAPGATEQMHNLVRSASLFGGNAEILGDSWVRVQVGTKRSTALMKTLNADPSVEYVQPNYVVHLLDGLTIHDPLQRAAIERGLQKQGIARTPALPDNPAIPLAPQQGTGPDPLAAKQWGMIDIGVKDAWKVTMGDPDMVVAVIDTGVDYTHEDLAPNMWRNPKEIPDNGIDDDNNGYIDDVIGWDFASNDNKPYDLKGAENPGHGTHCAGNIAAKAMNGLGVAGVAPNVRIMALRFLTENGQGTTADAVKAIHYAVDNGAKVLSNSWGSEGEEPTEGTSNQALRDAIKYAQDHNVLFIAAAGNGHNGVGYDNDTDARPGYPASYDFDNIISVAAIDNKDQLGAFSNWGAKTVDIAAPGVAVFSTTVGNNYSATIYPNLPFLTWDGTSMATPHVAGAAALYWSAYPGKSWREVKAAIIGSAKKIPAMAGKATSEGKLDVKALLNYN